MLDRFLDPKALEDYEPISADGLKLGMYVWLKCPWYKHPFPKNRFKLTSKKQIAVIQGLHLKDIFYHREFSDADEGPDMSSVSETEDGHDLTEVSWLGEQETTGAQAATKSSSREQFKQANRAYAETLRESSRLLRQLSDGQEAGAVAANQLVGQFTDDVFNSVGGLAIANIMLLKSLDKVQAAHSLNACILSLLVGRELELDRQAVRSLGLAALLHDIGEQRVPSTIRNKQRLGRGEITAFQAHPRHSAEMVTNMKDLPESVGEIMLDHHEHLDGSGYPRGLTESQIHPLALILRAVDEYNYLVNPRDGKPGLQPHQALSELYVKRRRQVALKVVIALVRVLSVYPPGTLVELSDGSIAIVTAINPDDRLRPLITIYEPKPELTTTLVDLNEHTDLTIIRTLQYSELPPELADRLKPTEVLKYLLM